MIEHHSGNATGGNPPANYERYFVPAIGAPLAEDLVRVAALRAGERVLDVACGTGVVARLAAREVGDAGSVAGLDPNPGMLAVARAATPPALRIDWHEAGAEAMPLPDAAFDCVLCQMGLQFMADRHAALGGMRRVLVPGGRLVLNVPGPTPPLFAVMREALARHAGAGAAAFVDQVFSLHDVHAMRDLAGDAGFDEASASSGTRSLRLPVPEAFLWQYVQSTPLAGAVARLDEAHRRALETEVLAGWRPFVDDGALALTLRVVTVVATRGKARPQA